MTSANIIITIVKKTVTAKTALSLHILIAITVAKAVARVCVKLFPISITPKSLSVLSSSFETRFKIYYFLSRDALGDIDLSPSFLFQN